jgi:hypothetical protein
MRQSSVRAERSSSAGDGHAGSRQGMGTLGVVTFVVVFSEIVRGAVGIWGEGPAIGAGVDRSAGRC